MPLRPFKKSSPRLGARVFVDYTKDLFEGLALRFGVVPTRQRLRDRIQHRHLAVDVGGNNAVADARQGDLKPFALLFGFPRLGSRCGFDR